ncbi:CidA/LrgA family protein [Stappia sp.]|uniref:CidA/LrgA family protein n=1 Tax=Stappia sp. TaxID=1870903 RepID=UPI0032D902AD
MLGALTVILSCQLIGEILVAASGAPVPGPVVGMVLLFAGLMVRGRIPDALARVGDALLTNLALLFVPAGVGVVLHLGLLGREGLAITVSLLVSTLVTIAVTALVMRWSLRGDGGPTDVSVEPAKDEDR